MGHETLRQIVCGAGHQVRWRKPTPSNARDWSRSATTSTPASRTARREGWLGEVDGLQISLIGARRETHPHSTMPVRGHFAGNHFATLHLRSAIPPAGQALSAIYTPQSRQFREKSRLVVRRR